jgi:predicted PurR-regulated permease PerM
MGFPPPTEKQARILWLSLTALALGVLLGLIGLLLWGFGWVIKQLSSVLLPLAIAGMIAYVLDPLVDILERARIPRARAIWLVFAMALMLVLMMLATVVPRLIFQTEELIQKFPDYSRQLRLKLQDWVDKPPLGITVPTSLINLLGSPTRGLTATNLPQTNLVSSTNVSDTELAGVAAAKKPETPE